MLADVCRGLAFMHANERLHQALGPESVLLSTTEERDVAYLTARLYDLSLSVDVSDAALLGGPTLGDLWDRGGGGPRGAEVASGALWGRRVRGWRPCGSSIHA